MAQFDDEMLTVDDVAGYLKLNQQTIRNWIDRGELRGTRVGARRVRIRRSDFEAFLEQRAEAESRPTNATRISELERQVAALEGRMRRLEDRDDSVDG